jgi:predicted component of type VI protein secretion system
METLRIFEEPITEQSALDGDVTALGSPGLTQLHHLRALSAALEPARAHYTATAIEQLRALPASVRRQVFGQVFADHPTLAQEPLVRELADELGVPATAITGTASSAAYARMEAILPLLAHGLAELERSRVEVAAELGADTRTSARLPRTQDDLLAWLLDESVAPSRRAEELSRALRALSTHAIALREAARQSARALLSETDPDAMSSRTRAPAWWPKPFRDAAAFAGLRALHAHVNEGRRYLEALHTSRFAQAYAARTLERT